MKLDAQGRPVISAEWDAINGIPPFVTQIGALSSPGSGTWLLDYDGDTDTWGFTTFTGFSLIAADVVVTPPNTGWPATDVQAALDDITAAIDAFGSAVTEQSGSSTVSYSGFSASPGNTTAFWVRTGKKVAVYWRADATGTSNSAVFTLSGLSSSIWPAHKKIVPVGQMSDSGVLVPGSVQVNTDGSLTFLRTYLSGGTTVQTDTVWSASGAKGLLNGTMFVYDMD